MYLMLSSLFILLGGFTALASAELSPQLVVELRAELEKHTDTIPPTQVLKNDRFMVWKNTCSDGETYVFKKRLENLSTHEMIQGQFHPKANIARFDQAEKFRKFIADENLLNVRVPEVYKIRFKDDSRSEDDTNTGIVEEFISHPDFMDTTAFQAALMALIAHQPIDSRKIFPNVDVSSLPDSTFRSLELLAVKGGLNDLHYGNLKYDSATQTVWLTDLEDFTLGTVQTINDRRFVYPLRPYLRWQIEQENRIAAGASYATSNLLTYTMIKVEEAQNSAGFGQTIQPGPPQLLPPANGVTNPDRFKETAISSGQSMALVYAKKELVKGLTFYATLHLAKMFYDSSSKSDVQIAYILDFIDRRTKELGSSDLDLIVRESIVEGGRKPDSVSISLFTDLHQTMCAFQAYLDETEKDAVDLNHLQNFEDMLIALQKKIKQHWGKFWLPNMFSKTLIKSHGLQKE